MNKSSRMVLIGEKLIGLVGLDEIFEKLYEAKQKPGKQTQKDLLLLAQKENYVPAKQERVYAEALLREYSLYYQRRATGSRVDVKVSYGAYQGISRENIPWYPTVYEEKCDGCRKCYDMCPQKVYFWEEKNNKPKVINPFACIVGCSACAEVCKLNAICFPPLNILDNLKSH